MKPFLLICCSIFCLNSISAQHDFYTKGAYTFTKSDSLRGMLRPERTCFDVTFYELDIEVNIKNKSIAGFVEMTYQIVENFSTLQIDLFENMLIDKIEYKGQTLDYRREFDAVFINFPKEQTKGKKGKIRIYYHGNPQSARMPPWDGGFVWKTDNNDNPWIGVACEGDGASLWWPNKDHLSDEPDSMAINITIPDGLTCVANGNLRSIDKKAGKNRFNWFVSYPINNYNVSINIANYAHWTEEFSATDGEILALDYYVLDYNLEKAKKHFKQTHQVLAAFEHYFDKYPFWEDGFALVETPYLGMEHQGAIAYGNQYKRGYLGGMIPRDMDWDYIIVHETGHEYFGNSISCRDLSEMWIHESFTTYMEALYVEYAYNYDDAVRYLNTQRRFIGNKEPILGPKDVNWEDWSSSDHYYKGAWILHTLRHAINDDKKWFDILKGFYQKFSISNITTSDFVEYVNKATNKNFSSFFDQYLEYPNIPVLEYKLAEEGENLAVNYRWKTDVENFDMPIRFGKKGKYLEVQPTTQKWQSVVLKDLSKRDFKIAKELFLIETKKQR